MPRSTSSTTRRPPPPDPLDAATEAHARLLAANSRFREAPAADDWDEPTGQHFHVHVAPPEPAHVAPLAHVEDAPKSRGMAGTVATLIAAAVAAAVAKLLGRL